MFNPSLPHPPGTAPATAQNNDPRRCSLPSPPPPRSQARAADWATTRPAAPVLVIASGNPHKLVEIAAMLAGLDLEVRPQPAHLEVEETGSTYAENARLKAEAAARLTGCWALGDDSGLEVDALGGAPGLFSARYAPSDPEKIHRLLHELGDSLYRGARFVTAMALADPSGSTVLEGCGVCHGRILRDPDGTGAGYDPVFHVREAGSSYARMSDNLRSRLGSRGKAARAMAPELLQLLGVRA